MEGQPKFGGLAEAPGGSAVLPDGTQLVPGTRRFLMYQILVRLGFETEVQSLRELAEYWRVVQQSVEVVPFPGVGVSQPLQHQWVVYFDRTDSSRPLSQQDLERAVVTLGSFGTMEGFWRYWQNLPLQDLKGTAFIRIFRKGVRPVSDDHCGSGGKWVSRHPSAPATRTSIWTALASAVVSDSVADTTPLGVVLCSNKARLKPQATSLDCVQLWVDASSQVNESVARALAETCLAQVHGPCHMEFGYVAHQQRGTATGGGATWDTPVSGGCSATQASGYGSMPGSLGHSPSPASLSAGGGSGRSTPTLTATAPQGPPAPPQVFRHNPYSTSPAYGMGPSSTGQYPKVPGQHNSMYGPQGYSSGGSYASCASSRGPPYLIDPGDWVPPDPADEAPQGDWNSAPPVPVDWSRQGGMVPHHPNVCVTPQQVGGVLRDVTASMLGLSPDGTQSAHGAPAPAVASGRPVPPAAAPYDSMPRAHSDVQQLPPPFTPISSLADGPSPSGAAIAEAKKKKRNKPDKHQRERLRRKKARQQMLEEVMGEMAGRKCCECEVHFPTTKCAECPSDRCHFCKECFTAIHRIGRRRQHADFVSVDSAALAADAAADEDAEAVPAAQGPQPEPVPAAASLRSAYASGHFDADDERVNTRSPPPLATPATPLPPTATSDASLCSAEPHRGGSRARGGECPELQEVLRAFGLEAVTFREHVTAELGSFDQLRQFTLQDARDVVIEFFAGLGTDVPALKRGKAAAAVLRWVEAGKN